MYDEQSTSGVARLALGLGLLSVLALGAAGPLHHVGWLGLAGAFRLLACGVGGAFATLLLAAAGLLVGRRRRSRAPTAAAALVCALAVLGSIAVLGWKASRVPLIHDVTTDLDHPPSFVAVVPLRAGALNPVEYGGAETAARQRRGYPDLAPLLLRVPPAEAFDRALAAARGMGWDLVASDPAAGRIEATDTTFWFGFKDDVVIRVTPAPGGSRVDVRSLSRVGGGDIGANAARVRRYLSALQTGP